MKRNKVTQVLLFTFLFSILGVGAAKAQLADEKIHDVSKKSRNGYLGNVVVDDVKKQFDMVFVTKSTNRKVKFDVYQYDYDLNLLNQFSDEQEVEKARKKYKWFNFDKEEKVIRGITAEANLMGQLVFKSKEIKYKYNWFTGKYKKTVRLKGKLKPKNDDGKNMMAYGALDIDETGEVLAMAGVKIKGVKNFENPLFHYRFMKVNADLDMVSSEDVILDYSHNVLWKGPIKRTSGVGQEPEEGDWGIVLVPYKAGGYKKIAPKPNELLFIRVGRDGKVKEKTPITSKVHTWKIIDIYEKNGSYFFYGPGISSKLEKTYYNGKNNPNVMEKGFTDFQIVQLKGGKATFVSAVDLEEFKTKAKKPAGQKKLTIYNGKRVAIRGLDVSSSGSLFINAQDYARNAQGDGNVYKDLFMFHFNKNGELVASYGIESTQKKGSVTGGGLTDARFYPTDGNVVESPDGKKLYWYLFPVKKIHVEKEIQGNYEYTYYIPRTAPRVGSIDLSSGEMSEFQEFGGKKFFLINSHPYISIEGGSKVIYLGEGGEKGKQLWLGKFDPTTL